MTAPVRYVTRLGCPCVCYRCGKELQVVCPTGCEPPEYVLEEDVQTRAAAEPEEK